MAGGFLYLITNTLFVLFLTGLDYFQPKSSVVSVNSKLAKAAVLIYQQGTFADLTAESP